MALPSDVAPVPGTTEVTSTSPISTPEFAASLPMALVPAGSAGRLSTSTSPILLVPAGQAGGVPTARWPFLLSPPAIDPTSTLPMLLSPAAITSTLWCGVWTLALSVVLSVVPEPTVTSILLAMTVLSEDHRDVLAVAGDREIKRFAARRGRRRWRRIA